MTADGFQIFCFTSSGKRSPELWFGSPHGKSTLPFGRCYCRLPGYSWPREPPLLYSRAWSGDARPDEVWQGRGRCGGSGQRGPQLQPRPAPQWRPGPAPPHGKAIRRLFQSTGQDELTSAPCGRGAEGQCVSLYGAQGLVLGPQALEHLSQPHSPLPEPPVFF